MKLLPALAATMIGVKVAVLLLNCVRFPVLRGGGSADQHVHELADVSVLIPARDEADRLPRTLQAVLSQHPGEVLVLDDSSSDNTAEVARQMMSRAGHHRARVLTGDSLPPGWAGKTWAVHQLAQAATSDTLVFLDADITLAPGALAAAVREQRQTKADVLSVFPRQVTASLGEHLVVPVVDDVLLCLLPQPLLSLPISAAATANGSCLIFTRDSYRQVGGFESVRAEVIEDVALARRTRALGMRLGLALGGDLIATRMYCSYPDVVGGLSRGLLFMSGGSRGVLVLGWLIHLGLYTVPVLRSWGDRQWLVPVVLAVTERVLVEVKTRRYAVWQAVLVPAVTPAIGPVVLRALSRPRTWRGRTYR